MATVKKALFEKIYVKESDIPLTKTRKALVKLFVLSKGFESYKDEKYTIVQCDKGRYRSITELHQLVQTRFPITSFDSVLKIVNDCIDEKAGIVMVYCATINKVDLRYSGSVKTGELITEKKKKNYYDKKGVDGSCLKDYEERMLQIKKEYNQI